MELLLFLSLSLAPSLPQDTVFEDFDAPGTTWAATYFSDVHLLGGMGMSREPLSVAQGAPETVPPLPINAGGDAEGRFFEATVPAANSFALSAAGPANVFRDGAMRAVVAFGRTSSFGSQSFGVMLRARINPSPPFGTGLNAYTAYLDFSAGIPGSATFALARWEDGVIRSQFALGSFTYGSEAENYAIEFGLEGSRLSGRLWRIQAQNGSLVTTPVVLTQGLGPLANQLEAEDASLLAGRAGVFAFTRSTNSVFCDEIQVKKHDKRRNQGASPGVAPLGTPAGPRAWLPWRFARRGY